jgi:predicted house-cleaning noncanonical NTP pyrophosphatase (MazG superfamily)
MPRPMKMIRDHVPGVDPARTRKGEPDDEVVLFLIKFLEEYDEFTHAPDKRNAALELADMLEVVHSLAWRHGFDMLDIEDLRRVKAGTHGCFHHLTILEDL